MPERLHKWFFTYKSNAADLAAIVDEGDVGSGPASDQKVGWLKGSLDRRNESSANPHVELHHIVALLTNKMDFDFGEMIRQTNAMFA